MNTSQKIYTFFSRYPLVAYKKGTMFIQPEDEIAYIYYLRKGFVRMFQIFPDGKELTVNIFQPESYLPLFLVFANAKNSYYFEPLVPSEFFKAPKENVLKFIQSDPEILTEFTTRISIGFNGLLENLQYQFFGSVHDKIAGTLLLLSKRFGKSTEKGIQIIIPLSHEDIAKLAGIARETTSLELERLSAKKIISYTYKHLIIRNTSALGDDL